MGVPRRPRPCLPAAGRARAAAAAVAARSGPAAAGVGRARHNNASIRAPSLTVKETMMGGVARGRRKPPREAVLAGGLILRVVAPVVIRAPSGGDTRPGWVFGSRHRTT